MRRDLARGWASLLSVESDDDRSRRGMGERRGGGVSPQQEPDPEHDVGLHPRWPDRIGVLETEPLARDRSGRDYAVCRRRVVPFGPPTYPSSSPMPTTLSRTI